MSGASAGARAVELAALARSFAHPLRIQILELLLDVDRSPSELAPHLGVSVSLVSYHVAVLERHGAVEARSMRQVRGAVQRSWRATSSARRQLDGLRDWLEPAALDV